MKQTAVVVAPGRGTYNKTELGYLARHHKGRTDLLDRFDDFRRSAGQPTLSELDAAKRFSGDNYTRGDNASALIYSCAYLDFLAIDRTKFDVVGITGNSMGWYTAMACAGALDEMGGLTVANTMGTLMHQSLIGGQLIYPYTDEKWVEIPGRRAEIESKMQEISRRQDHKLGLSIDLGGTMVLAGNAKGLAAFEDEMPQAQNRFPMRLPNHGAFHTSLQAPVAAEGKAILPVSLSRQPGLTMIDGRGGLWHPKAANLQTLWDYTLGHQVVEPYSFSLAITVAARELMPDLFIVLGPGNILGGAVAQSLVRCNWHGWAGKEDFQAAQLSQPHMLSMGLEEQRQLVV
ncbi:MAG: ACP S-malonyltransferase [Boseongicola sp.]